METSKDDRLTLNRIKSLLAICSVIQFLEKKLPECEKFALSDTLYIYFEWIYIVTDGDGHAQIQNIINMSKDLNFVL